MGIPVRAGSLLETGVALDTPPKRSCFQYSMFLALARPGLAALRLLCIGSFHSSGIRKLRRQRGLTELQIRPLPFFVNRAERVVVCRVPAGEFDGKRRVPIPWLHPVRL